MITPSIQQDTIESPFGEIFFRNSREFLDFIKNNEVYVTYSLYAFEMNSANAPIYERYYGARLRVFQHELSSGIKEDVVEFIGPCCPIGSICGFQINSAHITGDELRIAEEYHDRLLHKDFISVKSFKLRSFGQI